MGEKVDERLSVHFKVTETENDKNFLRGAKDGRLSGVRVVHVKRFQNWKKSW